MERTYRIRDMPVPEGTKREPHTLFKLKFAIYKFFYFVLYPFDVYVHRRIRFLCTLLPVSQGSAVWTPDKRKNVKNVKNVKKAKQI